MDYHILEYVSFYLAEIVKSVVRKTRRAHQRYVATDPSRTRRYEMSWCDSP